MSICKKRYWLLNFRKESIPHSRNFYRVCNCLFWQWIWFNCIYSLLL